MKIEKSRRVVESRPVCLDLLDRGEEPYILRFIVDFKTRQICLEFVELSLRSVFIYQFFAFLIKCTALPATRTLKITRELRLKAQFPLRFSTLNQHASYSCKTPSPVINQLYISVCDSEI